MINQVSKDTVLVEVRAKCVLNIDKKYLDSQISHLITKGDLKSTTVKIVVQGKEIESKTNSENIEGKSENPKPFKVSTSQYVSAFKKLKRKIDYNELETRVAKFKKYEVIGSFLTSYWMVLLLLSLFPLENLFVIQFFDREPYNWEGFVAVGVGVAQWIFLLNATKKRVKKYRVRDDEWVIFYTNSILDNLMRYSETDNQEMKKDYRKKAVENAKDFLSCIEKRWKIGRFKLAQDYFKEPLSELRKSIQYRIIPNLKDGDDTTIEKIEQIMRNFLVESRRLDLKGINNINEQMSSRLNEIKTIRFRDRLSTFFASHMIVKHGLFVSTLTIGCSFFYYLLVSQVEIQKEYAITVSVAIFLGLLTIYFRRPPKE